MTDTHRHEWVVKTEVNEGIHLWCRGCKDTLSDGEIQRRLNAVECLSVERAEDAAKNISDWHAEDFLATRKALMAYIITLEGDNA